ncbi:hypothetical protein [Tropicimonas sp. IMCC34011]|uniref:hypothetical protein n=1 Tax=Tropicimonas sp. IMCC34011 TaxID=2248759 RepID=UPI000E26857A|nr:hypothetical protein [Tropicimonas sp. IMCC34011]
MDRGFVFGAYGEPYGRLAAQAARTVRAIHPDIPIDLFADIAPEGADVFDEVHILQDAHFRPKFEALIRSRFERTLYLDSDIAMVAPVNDVFDLLGRFDVAAAHVQVRMPEDDLQATRPIPAAYPQINAGVLGIRRSDATRAFLETCVRTLVETGATQDQPIIRRALYEGDLRLAVLPWQYNLKNLRLLVSMHRQSLAPRIIHSSYFHRRIGDHRVPSLGEVIGPRAMAHIEAMIACDPTLGGDGREVAPMYESLPGFAFLKKLTNRRRKRQGIEFPKRLPPGLW